MLLCRSIVFVVHLCGYCHNKLVYLVKSLKNMCRGAIFYNNSITYGGREDNYVNSLRCNKVCCCFCCDRALRQRHTFFFCKSDRFN